MQLKNNTLTSLGGLFIQYNKPLGQNPYCIQNTFFSDSVKDTVGPDVW